MSMKNFNDIIGNQTRDFPICSAVPQPTALPCYIHVCLKTSSLTEDFPCFFLSCKANDRVKLAKTVHGPHYSTLVFICVVLLVFVSFCLLFVCKCVLPRGDNPIAVNKYITTGMSSTPKEGNK